ncbi:MAG: serine/threonine protein kinase [Deltaproteobacteria bacterium]|jgi:serine/threonine-protein kinase|nr:serine/threonine protein kinase [Deltaproteobacteria bacterium]MBW2533207.1 serine/threonine protein kinase [Deltaproteobacteria bacterium]
MESPATDALEGLPQIGQVVAGKYRIERVLGVGGMGVVVEATHTALDEKVAIKFLSGAESSDPERLTRFTREAWAAAKIKNEHVARVSDVAQLDDGTAYLVMEYLEGRDLDGVLASGPLPPQTAVDYVLQAAEAVAEAHKLGIVHRDLKPGNLFLTHRADGSPCVKVLDFGISKFTMARGMTRSETMMGSPHYMAPEQILSSANVDARVDVWALGVILYELCAGSPPFDAEQLSQIIERILEGQAHPLREVAPHVSAPLEAAVMHALATNADERYADLADFATALACHGSDGAQGSAKFIHGVLRGAPPPDSARQVVTTGAVAASIDGSISTARTVASEDRGIATEPTLAAGVMPRHCAGTNAPVTTALGPGQGKLGWIAAATVGAAGLLALGVAAIVWLGSEPQGSSSASEEPQETVTASPEPSASPQDETSAAAAATTAAATTDDTSSAAANADPSATPVATAAPSGEPTIGANRTAVPTTPGRPPPPPSKDSFDPWKGR